ncbi:MAG: hypothetical protein KKA73_10555 [Chloroflexi bacterium]|nr:hypothetical protein [Chloroflexota bacterium]MBU1748118.1 hypothetical protein [Chloroflexota bacterium]MBU1878726.1 hypothetical protein [Chloroflexota bacterium]
MERKPVFQAAAVAALVALVSVLAMAAAQFSNPSLVLQPSDAVGPATEFARATNEAPALALQLFAADSLFILSYLVVFCGLHATVVYRGRVLAWIGLGAGVLAAVFDAIENAFFITYALQALAGVPLKDPDLPLVYIVGNLKWMSAFAAFYALGLAWPRDGWLNRTIAGLMLLFTLVGVLGVAIPGLVALRGVFFLIGMPLFAWYFWQQIRNT